MHVVHIGKIFAKLLKSKLLSTGDLLLRQYSFRKEQSKIGVIQEITKAVHRTESHNNIFSQQIMLLVTINMKDAFNSGR